MQIEVNLFMQGRKKTQKRPKPKRLPRKPAKERAAIAVQIPGAASPGYGETLTNEIMLGRKGAKTTEYSLLFNSVLSSLTPGLKTLYYRSGIGVGRALYRICNRQKHYIWYEEGVADLVSFLENAGFKGITYNVFPDRIDIRFTGRDTTFLGTHMHVFEAGVMSGFLTAGKQQHVKVEEVSCSNNGSEFCHFITSSQPVYFEAKGREVLERFVFNTRAHLRQGTIHRQEFSEAYYALSSTVMTEQEYRESMHTIIRHVGSDIASRIRLNPRSIEKLFALLNLGQIKVKSIRPLNVEMRFPMLKAKKEFVDISITFLNGLLSNTIKKGASINTRATKQKDSYVIRIAESKK